MQSFGIETIAVVVVVAEEISVVVAPAVGGGPTHISAFPLKLGTFVELCPLKVKLNSSSLNSWSCGFING